MLFKMRVRHGHHVHVDVFRLYPEGQGGALNGTLVFTPGEFVAFRAILAGGSGEHEHGIVISEE
jgi:hypothetical protein